EIAADLGGGRDCKCSSLQRALPDAFVSAKEEGAVVAVIHTGNHHRAAECEAELIALKGGKGAPRAVQKEIVRIQFTVPKKLVDASMRLIGAGLDYHIDYAAGRTAELRRKGVGLHFKFLHPLHGGERRCGI